MIYNIHLFSSFISMSSGVSFSFLEEDSESNGSMGVEPLAHGSHRTLAYLISNVPRARQDLAHVSSASPIQPNAVLSTVPDSHKSGLEKLSVPRIDPLSVVAVWSSVLCPFSLRLFITISIRSPWANRSSSFWSSSCCFACIPHSMVCARDGHRSISVTYWCIELNYWEMSFSLV